jgi:hypothetical protein
MNTDRAISTERVDLSMNTVILPDVVVTAIPEKQLYWVGYDMYVECALANDFLSPEEFAAMTPQEKRGYEAAARHQADMETDIYLGNRNAFGDLTEY